MKGLFNVALTPTTPSGHPEIWFDAVGLFAGTEILETACDSIYTYYIHYNRLRKQNQRPFKIMAL